MKRMTIGMSLCLVAGSLFLSGCATPIAQPVATPQPCKERLGTFKSVEYQNVILAPGFADAGANKKAAKKIDDLLIAGMGNVFPGMKVGVQTNSPATDKTLVIRPVIKRIKFIGGAARFWVGAMAGSSAVLMQVDYIDKGSGSLLSSTEFYRVANAWGGGMSMGGTDNMMLSEIVQDVITYTVSNR